jgi:hypothetical protein
MVEDADVEDEVIAGQQLQAFDEPRLDAEIGIGLVLDQPADAARCLQTRNLLELRRDRLALFQRQRRDHAGELRFG